jgi:hypothetical protein
MWHAWGRIEIHRGVWWGNLRKRDHLEDPSEEGSMILKWVFKI